MSSTVVYVGRIPHGFYEDQMRAYFTQFGTIKNLRISRNKKVKTFNHYNETANLHMIDWRQQTLRLHRV